MTNPEVDSPLSEGDVERRFRDSKREKVADMLDGVASRIHERADRGSERVLGVGHSTAEKVEATAKYVREHDSREMLSDIEAVAKRHPAKSLLAVAIVGFLAGRALRND